MTIAFHRKDIQGAYATRAADEIWASAMLKIVDPEGKLVADIGCGGGIYSRAWKDLGAAAVAGIDFSETMIADARDTSVDSPSLSFVHADATDTGLPDTSCDIVFSRALVHHLPDLAPALAEAFRILKPGGTIIVQDRTFEDVLKPASPAHLRGYFFERVPRLLEIERARRPASADVARALCANGFLDIATTPLSEPRRHYASVHDLHQDLGTRTGRSILHALDDNELEDLVAYITSRLEDTLPVEESDFWTIWAATRPLVTSL